MDSPSLNNSIDSPSMRDNWEEKNIADLYGESEFDANEEENGNTLLQTFAKREVIKELLREQVKVVQNLKKAASNTFVNQREVMRKSFDAQRKKISRDNIKRILTAKKKQMETKMQTPPFLRTQDKVAFTLGLIVLLISEFVLLIYPQFMWMWYTFLLVPLLLARYYVYSKSKFHYFMLDFCYFAQVMLLVYFFAVPHNHIWFQVVFCATNGPLLAGVVMWRNSLVFHDLDKLTSVFIHLYPPLVTFCLRWFPSEGFHICDDPGPQCPNNCSLNYFIVISLIMVIYLLWQFMYLFKTEIVDGRKLRSDKQIMTSARWMSEVRPHPIWKYFKKRGAKENHAIPVLVGVQLLYTIATVIPTLIVFNSFTLHVIYLSLVSLICIWNGANFYFDIFSETYTKRLKVELAGAVNSTPVTTPVMSSSPPPNPPSPSVQKKEPSVIKEIFVRDPPVEIIHDSDSKKIIEDSNFELPQESASEEIEENHPHAE
eukprot:TRINITY_DN2732_c0_g1_i2.p1 TRINITY_DN2732_c0_g1~~TRINITY_DN2732_c0_g1_i2.p1  ORF type:complete len:541 (-),score=130.38 TRINITY_DN2732_c0_g1_i2:10-1464(-)